MTHERKRANRAAAVIGVVVGVAAALLGCEPAGPSAPVPPSVDAQDLRFIGSSADDGAIEGGAPLELRFSAPIDPATVGPRSVRVERVGSGRPVAATVSCDGDMIRVVIEPTRAPKAGESLRVVVEGAPSPRALRSAAGVELPERVVIQARAGGAAVDLVGPALVASHPQDGTADVTPGAAVELRFSEPLAHTRAGDAVSIRVRGVAVPATVRASSDRRRLLVRPTAPLPPGAEVTVAVNPWVMDDAGNPFAGGATHPIRFRTRSTALSEIREEFVSDEMSDGAATIAGWGLAPEPDLLVGRAGFACAVTNDSSYAGDFGERETLRFQVIVRPDDVCGTLASALRVRFAAIPAGVLPPVTEAWVEGGAFRLDDLDPSFDGNRRFAALATLAETTARATWEADERGGGVCEIPFRAPLMLDGVSPVLLDVSLTLAAGARVAGRADPDHAALVEGGNRERLRPVAALVTSGGAPCARSLWYDTNCPAPRWLPARTVALSAGERRRVSVEYQAAPAAIDGGADEAAASQWSDRLDLLPPWRFVRFRVRFDGLDGNAGPAALDSVTMPFVSGGRAR